MRNSRRGRSDLAGNAPGRIRQGRDDVIGQLPDAAVLAPATTAAELRPARRAHHGFYAWAGAAAFAIVFAGFARTYYLKVFFGALVVQDPVRVDAVRPVAIVAKDDANGVAHDGTNEWTEKAEVIPRGRPGLERAEGAIGVLAIEHLAVAGTHGMRIRFAEKRRVGVRRTCDLVAPSGHVVPRDGVRRDVVRAGATAGDAPGRGIRGAKRERGEDGDAGDRECTHGDSPRRIGRAEWSHTASAVAEHARVPMRSGGRMRHLSDWLRTVHRRPSRTALRGATRRRRRMCLRIRSDRPRR
jgi:hypothetical protein